MSPPNEVDTHRILCPMCIREKPTMQCSPPHPLFQYNLSMMYISQSAEGFKSAYMTGLFYTSLEDEILCFADVWCWNRIHPGRCGVYRDHFRTIYIHPADKLRCGVNGHKVFVFINGECIYASIPQLSRITFWENNINIWHPPGKII